MRVVSYRGKWAVVIRADGRRIRKSTGLPDTPDNRPAAEATAAEWERELARPDVGTCDHIFEAYLRDRQPISEPDMRSSWKRLARDFHGVRPDQIDRQTCRAYTAARLSEGVSTTTARKELVYLKSAIAYFDKSLGGARFELPPQNEPRDRWLTKDEARRLIDAARPTPHIHLAVLLALHTAGRLGALCELSWHQVDFERREIWLGVKASGKRRARVPINDELMAALSVARECSTTGRVLEWGGRPINRIGRAWYKALARSGLEDLHFHDLRHTSAVWMAGAGVPMSKISQFLGHSSTAVTERIYARFAPEHMRDAADALLTGSNEPRER